MTQLVRTPLWKHQIEDVEKLRDQPRVLIANDMGTGKTLTAVERDLWLRKDGKYGHLPTLVVAPLSTHGTWQETFTNETDLEVIRIDRKKREKLRGTSADVYIVHYEALRLMPWLRTEFEFGHAILDECHRVKSRTAEQTKRVKKLRIKYMTAMSGSPVTDRPQDIWQILNILNPKLYSSYWNFFYEYVVYRNKVVKKTLPNGKVKVVNYKEVLGPSEEWPKKGLPAIQSFFTRRRKDEVLPNLPPKIRSRVYIDISPQQRRIYDEMAEDMLTWIRNSFGEDEALPAPAVISKLQRLQMIALGTPEFGVPVKKKDGTVFTPIKLVDPSTKVDAVMEILEDHEDEQFVIFSQYKGPLRILRERFERKDITYGSFTGDDSTGARERAKKEFIEGKRRVLLGTIGSGGVGVDGLQHASCNVIFLDRDWSPEINKQAEDRLHRGGQTRNVNIIDIMARDTVDFERRDTIEMKAGWVRTMLGDKQ